MSGVAGGALLGELCDLKRVRVAGGGGSLAEQGFRRAWAALVAGEEPGRVARRETARALVDTKLPAIDAALLQETGMAPEAAREVLDAALGEACGDAVDPAPLRRALDEPGRDGPTPPFVAALAAQPRAGATAPGRPRLVLTPAESHAEHCWVTAVVAALLAPEHGADAAAPFLCGLAHHLHNARLPDAGFAGETLLGAHLAGMLAALHEAALGELSEPLRGAARAATALAGHVRTPEARAFVAADVLDRVLQMRFYERQATFSTAVALDDLELVHAGPLQEFGLQTVAAAGLR